MPMNFPDMKSLERHADMVGFRAPNEGEAEDHYRIELADFVQPTDFIESLEIRNKVGWDKFSAEQNKDMIRRSAANSINKKSEG